MGTCIIFVVSNLALLALVTTGVDAALVGLVLSYALNTTSGLVRSFFPTVYDFQLLSFFVP